MVEYILFIVSGIFLGLLIGLFFFRADKAWVKLTSFSGGQAAFIGLFLTYYELFGITENNKLNLFTVYFVTALVTSILTVLIFAKQLKKQEGPFQLSMLDILLGYQQAIKNYYHYREKQIDQDLNIDSLNKLKARLESKESQLNKKEHLLTSQQQQIDSLLQTKPHLVIPINHKIVIDLHFLKMLPEYLFSITEFYHQLHSFTKDFCKDMPQRKCKNSSESILKTYLSGVCLYIGECLFKWRGVRVHIRLHCNSREIHYKWMAFYEYSEYKDEMSDISDKKGMIFNSARAKRSLVKSANLSLHESAGNDQLWEDYITLTFNRYIELTYPLISIGISVKNEESHREMLYFLSYLKIEEVIQNAFTILEEELPITHILRNEAAKYE